MRLLGLSASRVIPSGDVRGMVSDRRKFAMPAIQRHLQAVSAVLLSVPLIGSAANHVFKWAKPPMSDGSRGAQMWELIRDGGLMDTSSDTVAIVGNHGPDCNLGPA